MFLSRCLLLIVGLSVIGKSCGIYYFLKEGQTKCYIVDEPDDTLVLVKYKNHDAGLNPIVGAVTPGTLPPVEMWVEELSQGVELYNGIAQREGSFQFNTIGECKVCFTIPSEAGWLGTQRSFKLESYIEIGEDAIDYDEMAKVEHMTAIEVEMRKLDETTRGIRKELQFQRAREAAFRNTSESTNSRVAWWSLFTTGLIVALSIAQVVILKSFFKKKKLV
uniref:GOLD domain-containing protein n=1 Tax=Spongospora subterranea TaxID=70186 RepID=A0A0H5RK26_9EUKA|eukprot:CRZ09079.1 hypothetical protein [Spongospora subterranea]